MDEKRREAGNSPAGPSSAELEPASTRRRAGAQKRKANSLSGSSSSSTPSKRITRDKSNLISHSPINHNGPLTRARQGAPSGNLASGLGPGSSSAKLEETGFLKENVKAEDLEELNKASEEWEALEAKIEAQFEAVRSRDSNAHVVPNHCGWFSWTKIHNLEERVLPSFFNGKSPMRTPDVYMQIRNWIMKKFHANPNKQIELKDLSDLEVGDLDAQQEVLEFLDYWGLINFHPFPSVDSAVPTADGDGAIDNEMAKKYSLLEKLFHFEAIESRPPVVPRPNFSTPSIASGFFPESAIFEDLVRPDTQGVEYHCNSCAADCSRKRYHCQKEADFDLCMDCFSNGKFGSGMSSSDFILMEPAEAPGLSGGKWTDQETLLLLEALELYKENWNEIAEHVATKTKAQCIMHFVQMPIEDVFLNCDENIDANSKETAGPAAMSDETSVPKDVPETTEKATTQGGQAETTPMETSKHENEKEGGVSVETSKPETGNDAKVGPETSKPEETNEAKDGEETDENSAVVALREAFEAVGYTLTSESPLSFADVGNPVMALAGFFARLVGPNIAAASAQSSLKSLSGSSPNIQLAARNCFLLEDPPDDKKEQFASESVVNDMADRDAQNVENSEEKSPEEDKSTPVLNQKNSLNNHGDQSTEVSGPEGKVTSTSANDLLTDKKEPGSLETDEEAKKANLNESVVTDQSKDCQPNEMRESDVVATQVPASSVEETRGKETPPEEPSQPTESVKEVDMSDSVPHEMDEPGDAAASKLVGELSKPAEALENVETGMDSPSGDKNEKQPVKSSSPVEPTQATEASNDVEMSDSLPSGRSEPQQPVASNATKENGATSDGTKGGKNENHDSTETKGDLSIDKLKRAAVTALSAAAVKAKLLAEQEEDQIQQLTTSLIEKQLHKMESKLAFFNEMEGVMMRVKEQLDRSRQRLYHERAQIIAARLGLPASSSRAMPPSNTANRIATNFANSLARPPMGMAAPRPPMLRPMGPITPTPSNPFVSTTIAGSSIRPASSDNLSSVESK